MSPHAKGLLLALLGVLCISPDTLLIRLADVDYGATLFWRGLFTSLGLLLLVICTERRQSLQSVRRLGRPGLLVIGLFAISNLSFVMALQLTTVANTLVIVSSAPLFAALLGRVFLADPVGKRTWVAIAVVIAAIAFIFAKDVHGPTSWGNLGALMSAIALSATFVVTRHAQTIDMTPAMAGSALLSTLLAIPFVSTFSISGDALLIFALLGLFLTAAFTLLFIAPRHISAAEVSLLMPLETVLGTYLVWVFIGEQPSSRALIGGAVIIAVLTVNSFLGIRQNRPG
ncbi:MAG: EamA family transporter [Rhodospirillales bacterium]|nr:EamA family transporter [Rhodospirillales bacterium]